MYQVVITGIRDSVARSDAVRNLAALFKTTPDQVERLLATSRHILKKGITEEVAGKYKSAIEAAGGDCRVEREMVPIQTLDVDLSPPPMQVKETPTVENIAVAEKPESKLKMLGWTIGAFIVVAVLITVTLSKGNAVPDRALNPDGFLQHLVSTDAIVLGTKDGETTPSEEIAFSNGYMMDGKPGSAKNSIISGHVLRGSTPYSTCVFFTLHIMVDGQDELCVAVRDFETRGVSLRKGELYIYDHFNDGSGEIYRAQVK